MKRARTALAVSGISALILLSSYAAQSAEQKSTVVATSRAKAVVILEDQEARAFRFMIDGQEVARLDSNGLHVRENLSYGGYNRDYGHSGFDAHVAQGAKAE